MTSFIVERDLVFIMSSSNTGKSGFTLSDYSIKPHSVSIVFLIFLSLAICFAGIARAQSPDKPVEPQEKLENQQITQDVQPGNQKSENAQTGSVQCDITDRGCMLDQLGNYAVKIEQKGWRDQTLRELAKSYAADGQIDKAIDLISGISSPDTKAMTIRGIGMELAGLNYTPEQLQREFAKLSGEAAKINHSPSHAIALTYIAMAQAFAGDNDGAWKTAESMENDALRNKAYAETSEVQAEHGQYDAAIKSIGFIDNEPFRNKAYGIIAKIFADRGLLEESYQSALKITNPYNKTQAMQYMLDRQKAYQRGETPKNAAQSNSGGSADNGSASGAHNNPAKEITP